MRQMFKAMSNARSISYIQAVLNGYGKIAQISFHLTTTNKVHVDKSSLVAPVNSILALICTEKLNVNQ